MSDLIKREDAIKAMEQRYKDILRIFKRKVKDGEKAIVLDMIGCIKSLPSADRPQGYWIKTDVATYRCSKCGKIQIADDDNELNFCCCCGSRNKVRKLKGADDE